VRKRTDTELMPPPPPAKRIKRPRKVLDEDTYTDALSHIIARDFFPGLLESETQQEYLDALDSKDEAWISSAGRRLQQVMTPGRRRGRAPAASASSFSGQTPTTGFLGDTPVSVISTSTVAEEKITVDTNMNLGAFQAKYTSEDNESFYKLLDKQNQKRAEKYAWLWRGNKLPSKQQLKQKEIEDRIRQTRSLQDDGYSDKRLAIRDKDDRPAAPDSWASKPNNQLMFVPEGVDGLLETPAQRAQAESRAAPKTVVYENTRMVGPPAIVQEREAASVPSSPSLSAVRDAIAGRSRPGYQDSTTGAETPRVNGYAFVDDEEPEPEPASRPPLISIAPADATPNPFQLQEQGRREALHHKMVERISRSKRTSALQGLTGRVERTPVPKYPSSPRVSGGVMTPAAQRLWGKIDSAGSRRSGDFSPFNKVKATPTPRGRGSGLKNLAKRGWMGHGIGRGVYYTPT